jgi:hypothetical protein
MQFLETFSSVIQNENDASIEWNGQNTYALEIHAQYTFFFQTMLHSFAMINRRRKVYRKAFPRSHLQRVEKNGCELWHIFFRRSGHADNCENLEKLERN